MSSRQWETYFGRMGWSGGTFGTGAYSDGWSEGYTVNGNHSAGATVIALTPGSGQLLPGTDLRFAGDDNPYRVVSSTGVASVTSVTIASPGLIQSQTSGTELEDKLPAAPADQMAYLLTGHLLADPVLSLALGGRIERMGIEPQADERFLPRAYVFPGSVNQEGVAGITSKDSDIVVSVVFALSGLSPASEGGVTLASVLTQIERVAAAHHQMTVQLSATGNDEVDLADYMNIQGYQTDALLDAKDRPMAFSQSIQFRYHNVVRLSTGRIWQQAA